MAEAPHQDPAYVTAMLVVAIVLGVVVLRLLPFVVAALIQLLWQVVPGILTLTVIVAVLKGMVKRLFDS